MAGGEIDKGKRRADRATREIVPFNKNHEMFFSLSWFSTASIYHVLLKCDKCYDCTFPIHVF